MTVNLSAFAGAGAQFFDNNGVPLAGGLIYTYAAGTTTPSATYTSSSGSIANTNPIVLDSSGRVPNEIWLTASSTYKFVLQTANATQIGSWDNVPGTNDFTTVYNTIYGAFAGTTTTSQGANLVGFKQGNSSGYYSSAVAQTVQTKLEEVVSVKDFGAKGDGSTDDTLSIQNALNSGAPVIFFPAGTYKIAGASTPTATTLVVPSTVVELRGQGGDRGTTRLQYTGTNTSGNAFDIQSVYLRSMSNLYISTNSQGNFTNGINVITGLHYCNWTNVSVDGGATTLWNFNDNCYTQCFINCNLQGTGAYTGQTAMKLGASANAFDFHSCVFNACGIGLWAFGANTENVNFFGGEIASNSGFGVFLGSNAAPGTTQGIWNFNFYGVYFENNPINVQQYAANMQGLSFYNCYNSEGGATIAHVNVLTSTYSITVFGGVYTTGTGTTGYVINLNNIGTIVDTVIDSVLISNGMQYYTNAGAQVVDLRTSRVGSSPGQIIQRNRGIEFDEYFNTAYSYANKRIRVSYGSGGATTARSEESGFGPVWDTQTPQTGLWSGNTWSAGSICYNQAPASGSTMGWVCTVGGTPGTWKPMPNLP